jgi:hypothetical protein
MLHTKTVAGIEIIINPAHIAAAMVNCDSARIELANGTTYNLPTAAWEEIKKAMLKKEN